MKTPTFCSLLLLLLATGLRAQIATAGDYRPEKPFARETVSFHNPNDCEQVIIQTKHPEQLLAIEFIATDAYLAQSWSTGQKPDKVQFPMKFSVLPGKVNVRFKKKGENWRTMEADLYKGKPLVINLEEAGVFSPNG